MATIGKLAQLISDTYYKSNTQQNANFSLRYFAELIAGKVAKYATADAFTNSNQGETTYANNQFITVYKAIPIVEEVGEKYSVLPATPTALPNGQEIVQVRIEGNRCMDCIPMKNQMSFAQGLIGLPSNMVLYKVEGKRIVYETSNPLIEGTVLIKMVGSIPEGDIFSLPLNVPKNVEDAIFTEVLSVVMPLKAIPVDNINDAVSQ